MIISHYENLKEQILEAIYEVILKDEKQKEQDELHEIINDIDICLKI